MPTVKETQKVRVCVYKYQSKWPAINRSTCSINFNYSFVSKQASFYLKLKCLVEIGKEQNI